MSEQQTRQLVARAKLFATAPDDANEAMSALIEQHEGLLKRWAQLYASDVTDAYQIAISGLWEAVAAFDENIATTKRCKFSTFAAWRVRGKLSRVRLRELNTAPDFEEKAGSTQARAIEEQVEARLLEQSIISALRAYEGRTATSALLSTWELLRDGCKPLDVAHALRVSQSKAASLCRIVRQIAKQAWKQWNEAGNEVGNEVGNELV